MLLLQRLLGYELAVKETARETGEKIELEEELKLILDSKLQIILEHIKDKPEITFTYFVPDTRKKGGKYITKTGLVKKADLYKQILILEDSTEIQVDDLIDISGEIFKIIE